MGIGIEVIGKWKLECSVGMGMGMIRWEWEGNGNMKVIPAHLYFVTFHGALTHLTCHFDNIE